MATTPTFSKTARLATSAISAANTNRDGTGTIATVLSGVSVGTRVEEVVIQATGTTTAGMVRLFTSTDSGTTWRLYDEIPVSATTPSGTTAAFRTRRIYQNLVLGSSTHALGVSTHNAEAFNVTAHGGDLD